MLPMLMPALVAGVRGEGDVDDGDDGVGGAGDVDDKDNKVSGDEDLGDDEAGGDDTVSDVVASAVKEAASVDDADAESEASSLVPHVCAATASFDVMSNRGVLA